MESSNRSTLNQEARLIEEAKTTEAGMFATLCNEAEFGKFAGSSHPCITSHLVPRIFEMSTQVPWLSITVGGLGAPNVFLH